MKRLLRPLADALFSLARREVLSRNEPRLAPGARQCEGISQILAGLRRRFRLLHCFQQCTHPFLLVAGHRHGETIIGCRQIGNMRHEQFASAIRVSESGFTERQADDRAHIPIAEHHRVLERRPRRDISTIGEIGPPEQGAIGRIIRTERNQFLGLQQGAGVVLACQRLFHASVAALGRRGAQ